MPLSLHRLKNLIAFATVLALGSATFGDKSNWQTNVETAKQLAASQGKDLLLDFTGSDWCHWCIKLTDEVFSQPDFDNEALRSFVLVEIDFPSDRASQSDFIATQNNQLSKQFEIESFPTVVLADSQGRPYAKTGYRAGGPQPFLAHLAELREKRIKRDEAFARADKLEGVEKAKSLDEGLRAVGAEYALTAYSSVVNQIMALDANDEGGLKSRYEEFLARRRVGDEVKQLMACYQPGLETEYISRIQALEQKYQPKGRLLTELQGVLGQLMLKANRPGEVIQLADSILKKESVHPASRLQWRIMKVMALSANRQLDDAFALIDNISSDHSTNETIVAACVGQKALIMLDNNQVTKAHSLVQSNVETLTGAARQQMQKLLQQIESRM